MLAVRRAKRPCPGCQSLLLTLVEPTLSTSRQPVCLRLQGRGSSKPHSRIPTTPLRRFSCTRARRKDTDDHTANPDSKGLDNSSTAPIQGEDATPNAPPCASAVPPNEPTAATEGVEPEATPGGDEGEAPTDAEVEAEENAQFEAELEAHIQSEIERVLTEFERTRGSKLSDEEREIAEKEVRKLVEHHLLFPEDGEESDGPDDQDRTSHEEIDPHEVVRGAREVFRDSLPKGYLTPEEQVIYNRLYGEPLRETTPYDVGMPLPDMDALKTVMKNESGKNTLLKESAAGHLEEVEYHIDVPPVASSEEPAAQGPEPEPQPPSEDQFHFIQAAAKNKREYDALMKLQKDFEAAAREHIKEEQEEEAEAAAEAEFALALAEEQWDEVEPHTPFEPPEELTPEDIDASRKRMHRYSEMGKFATSPKSVLIPKATIIEPITELLKRTHPKHVRLAAETSLGGPGLPHSPATRKNKHGMFPQYPVGIDPGAREMSEIEADAFLATVFPFNYASALSTLTEVRKRMGSDWIPNLLKAHHGQGPRILDVGSGGAGAAAWEDVLRAEWGVMKGRGEVEGPDPDPHGRKTVIVGSDALRHRISRFLHNTTFLPRMPDYVHSQNSSDRLMDTPSPTQGKKSYDLIIASHLFMPYSPSVNKKDAFRRDFILENLWSLLNPEGGVLLVFEKGHPRGFEEVADVRHRLLEEFIYTTKEPPVINEAANILPRERVPGRILAPCTNHHHCPMYKTPGVTHGRKDFCHFKQRFIRPHFLQRILNAKHFNHEDVQFSYVAVQRGVSPDHSLPSGSKAVDNAFKGYLDSKHPPSPWMLPRNILQPLKRTGHVTMDLCTPAGNLERWTVPRSFGKQAYHDARKARWGDLWALGAKTRVHRTPRLGRGSTLEDAMLKRTYNVQYETGPDGEERMVLPPKATEQEEKKKRRKAKYVEVPRTSRHNRKVAWEKEVMAMEREGLTRAALAAKFEELE